uniref:Uncharacterized protein n=1 Tax=Calcidiscus leptoporus TaxID=127549 RepID=A0A7S0NTF4_9EUKA|mmetsp:Transcript_24057/g.55832  ORF Transcript_24057/g.55832 Transcript_24057/m.55832 type:complete len:495 (+) Transcript_24057:228-1712(+)
MISGLFRPPTGALVRITCMTVKCVAFVGFAVFQMAGTKLAMLRAPASVIRGGILLACYAAHVSGQTACEAELNRADAHTSCAVQRMRTRRTASIVAFGGSVTWGAGLDNPVNESWANVLATLLQQINVVDHAHVRNLAIRAHGSEAAANCFDNMLRPGSSGSPVDDVFGAAPSLTNHAVPPEPADIVLFEFSINGQKDLDKLMRNLRRRYPDAIFLYVQHFALWAESSLRDEPAARRKNFLENATWSASWYSPDLSMCPIRPDLQANFKLFSVKLFSLRSTLRSLSPKQVSGYFAPDLHHLSRAGHALVAEGALQTIVRAAGCGGPGCDKHRLGPDRADGCAASETAEFHDTRASSCFLWYNSGKVDPKLHLLRPGVELSRLEGAGTKYAFLISGDCGLGPRQVGFAFRAAAGATVQIAFMRDGGAKYGEAKVTLDHAGTNLVQGGVDGFQHHILTLQTIGVTRHNGTHHFWVEASSCNRSFAVAGVTVLEPQN